MDRELHVVISCRMFTDQKCFGPGVAALLTLVKTCHSLRCSIHTTLLPKAYSL